MLKLTLHHRQNRLRLPLGTRHPKDRYTGPDRRQWIAQFVGEAREEHVLATTCLPQSCNPPADEHEPRKRDCHDDQLKQVQTQHLHVLVVGVAQPRHEREASQRYRAENGERCATRTQHSEHQCDEKEGGERESGIGGAVDHEQHRRHRGEKLESGETGIGKPQVQPGAEEREEREYRRRGDCRSLNQRLAVQLALRVKDDEHHQVERRERTGEQETSEAKALADLVPGQRRHGGNRIAH